MFSNGNPKGKGTLKTHDQEEHDIRFKKTQKKVIVSYETRIVTKSYRMEEILISQGYSERLMVCGTTSEAEKAKAVDKITEYT